MEGRRVIEDVVPTKWVDAKSRNVFWPRGNFKQTMEEDQYPVVGQWHEFPLIKVKVSSGKSSKRLGNWLHSVGNFIISHVGSLCCSNAAKSN